MKLSWCISVYVLVGLTCVCIGQLSNNKSELLDWCIDGLNHKTKPGPEDDLHRQCLPWQDRSCCTQNISTDLHTKNMYNFDWDHCNQVKPMSKNCRKHFIQDLCFYECEPNLGPWIVEVDMKIRKQRAYGVPLCASDCDSWYNDCKDEYTCVENWTRDFAWINGLNTCPLNHTCQPYRTIYNNSAKQFCESIWDHAWVYTPDEKSCMRLWFNGSHGNPNDKVAKDKVAQMYSIQDSPRSAASSYVSYLHFYALFLTIIPKIFS